MHTNKHTSAPSITAHVFFVVTTTFCCCFPTLKTWICFACFAFHALDRAPDGRHACEFANTCPQMQLHERRALREIHSMMLYVSHSHPHKYNRICIATAISFVCAYGHVCVCCMVLHAQARIIVLVFYLVIAGIVSIAVVMAARSHQYISGVISWNTFLHFGNFKVVGWLLLLYEWAPRVCVGCKQPGICSCSFKLRALFSCIYFRCVCFLLFLWIDRKDLLILPYSKNRANNGVFVFLACLAFLQLHAGFHVHSFVEWQLRMHVPLLTYQLVGPQLAFGSKATECT